MKREHLEFLISPNSGDKPQTSQTVLQKLGWQPFFAQQTDVDQLKSTPPVRVTEVHRNGLQVIGKDIDILIPPGPEATVGDWLLLNQEQPTRSQVLQRKSLIQRRAAGHDRRVQLIAANIDTAFIVTSCNADFNIARLERYIALVLEAKVSPVIVLTKPDLTDDAEVYVEQAQKISAAVPVVCLNAKSDEPLTMLSDWCKSGQTVAFLGSSGVGKSTLTNALAGNDDIATQPIREDDAKGRHTTTRRQLHFLSNGCAVLDTPGMRELQLTDAQAGISNLFSDIEDMALQCKFNDCSHQQEPGCAIIAALENGQLEKDRLRRWQKLVAEERHNSESLAERRSRDRAFGKMVRQAQNAKNRKN